MKKEKSYFERENHINTAQAVGKNKESLYTTFLTKDNDVSSLNIFPFGCVKNTQLKGGSPEKGLKLAQWNKKI